ncbi:hypothetical protein GPL17_16625 [Bradyrhizobium yuanmingense]|uniref:hypothetical protein n=1 Tax=Bradyrhizobium yuanmingense TaxID=108015 RepID=UPI0012F7BE76|nr:hypothetical protein [Bradyrhizobium yuanmingense]MVT52109.1 hypothetical protein [Bradyrhizobium yuanmingense]
MDDQAKRQLKDKPTILERYKDAVHEMEIEELLELIRELEDELIKRRPFDR